MAWPLTDSSAARSVSPTIARTWDAMVLTPEDVARVWQALVRSRLSPQRLGEFLGRDEVDSLALYDRRVLVEAGAEAMRQSPDGYLLLGEWLDLCEPTQRQMRDRPRSAKRVTRRPVRTEQVRISVRKSQRLRALVRRPPPSRSEGSPPPKVVDPVPPKVVPRGEVCMACDRPVRAGGLCGCS